MYKFKMYVYAQINMRLHTCTRTSKYRITEVIDHVYYNWVNLIIIIKQSKTKDNKQTNKNNNIFELIRVIARSVKKSFITLNVQLFVSI